MGQTITVQDVQKALNTHLAENKKVINNDFAKAINTALDKYTKKVTKVNGQYPQFNMILSHVVQGFKAEWQALGKAEFKSKILKNYHQKVNFPIIPAEILGNYLAEMYEEGVKPTNKEITKRILEGLFTQVREDLDILSITGVYDAAAPDGQFGKSLDGIEQVITNITADTDHPAYKIPISVLDDTNVVEEITKFEKLLPAIFKKKIKRIFMSENNMERYGLRYEDLYGRNTTYKDGKALLTRLGKREIVGLSGLSDNVVFAAPDGLLLSLVDIIDNPPKITDIQVQDYTVKVFMEFWKGYDFAINEAVMVANFTDATKGLGDADKMALYYPREEV